MMRSPAGTFTNGITNFASGLGRTVFSSSPSPPLVQLPPLPMRADLTSQLSAILSLPTLSIRCTELTVFINRTALAELKVCYPTILQHIYGFTAYPGWGLRQLNRQYSPRDSDAVLRLLGSDGPLIQLAYRLMGDHNLRYEFPLCCLPTLVERNIIRNEIPYFFPKSITFKYNNQGTPCSMMLNPFEYYFFVYATIQLGSRLEQNNYLFGWANLSDGVYTDLLDDFLNYFMPCSGRGVPPIPANTPQPDTSYIPNAFHFRTNRLSSSSFENRSNTPRLLKASVLHEETPFPSLRDLSFSHELSAVDKEVWRTETMLNILIIMWMNVESNDGFYNFETSLPSVELVKSVRMIVRHFHFFCNVINNSVLHPLDDVKKTLFPVFQKQLYLFLTYLFLHWPMDNTFRIVYETWLSYIQPWRYSSNEGVAREGDDSMQVDTRWRSFILENILFYNNLLQLMLKRVVKSDLTSIRHAHMFFRVVKIFTSQRMLKPTLKTTDAILVQMSRGGGGGVASPNDYGSPATPKQRISIKANSSCSNTTLFSNNTFDNFNESVYRETPNNSYVGLISSPPQEIYTSAKLAHVKQILRELGGPHFTYNSLFATEYRDLTRVIFTLILEARDSLKESLTNPANKSLLKKNTNWLKTVSNFFTSDDFENSGNSSSNAINEKQRVLAFLDSSIGAFAEFFDIHIPENTFDMPSVPVQLLQSSSLTSIVGVDGGGTRAFRLGNPDKAPIRHGENAAAVHFLSLVAHALNRTIVPMIREKYFDRDFGGSLLRATFAGPQFYNELKTKNGPAQNNRLLRYLPPRIVLRPCANTIAILNMVGFMCLGILFEFEGYSWISWPFVLYFIYILLRSLLEPAENLQKLRSEFEGYY